MAPSSTTLRCSSPSRESAFSSSRSPTTFHIPAELLTDKPRLGQLTPFHPSPVVALLDPLPDPRFDLRGRREPRVVRGDLPGGARSPAEPVSCVEFPANRENKREFSPFWVSVPILTTQVARNFSALRRNSRVGENGSYFRQTGKTGSANRQQFRRNRQSPKQGPFRRRQRLNSPTNLRHWRLIRCGFGGACERRVR